MERSSRFISLSGLSGIAAGICASIGVSAAWYRIRLYYQELLSGNSCSACLEKDLIIMALIVFAIAFVSAVFFTWLRTRKDGSVFWGSSSKRLLWNTMIPMLTGGIVLLRMVQLEQYQLLAPFSLIFYGLALVNGSKYTMGEVRYLGYAEIILGGLSLWFSQHGLVYWGIGFGLFHIIYGIVMWWKYERSANENEAGL